MRFGVAYAPVNTVVVMFSVISFGMRVCRDLTMDFLFVVIIPPRPRGLGFSFHAVITCLGGGLFGPLAIFPMYVSCLVTMLFSAVGMLWNIFWIQSFVILYSLTCRIPIFSILWMLLCQNTSSLFR